MYLKDSFKFNAFLFFVLYGFVFFCSGDDKKKLKILFIDHHFPALTQTFILNQITSMIDRGHDVTILSLWKGDYASQNKIPGEKRPAQHPDISKYNLLSRVCYSSLPLDKRNYDVIICEFGNIGKMFLELRKRLNITGKFITFFRGRDLNALPGGNRGYYQSLFRQGDFFLCVCNDFKIRLEKLGCPRKKIGVVHSTIDCAKFKYRDRVLPLDNVIRIVATNRLVEKKGTQYAIKAISKLISKGYKIEFNILGGGPLYKDLKALISRLRAEKNIHLLGWKSQAEVIEMLDSAHIFILPSVTGRDKDREGIPNAIMEAMAMGLPVVSTFHSGIPELVQNRRTGFLVPERDIRALADRIEYLINNSENWPGMSKSARRHVELFFNKDVENNKLEAICYMLAGKSIGSDKS